jgi:2-furoyl-CoA dehydrogenase large subunit
MASGTNVEFTYEVAISGKVASIAGRMLDSAAKATINLFFRRLVSIAEGADARPWWRRLIS